jgi:uncharacterized protein with ATP-grasp and redox domains
MKTSLDCVPCFAQQALDAARAASSDPAIHEQIVRDVLQMVAAADLVIAKGQGNFETLSSIEANIFFLLKIKCPVVVAHTGVDAGTQALICGGTNRRG